MRITKVKCHECGNFFEKRNADYNRTERLGKRHFCSRSCSVICGNKEMSISRRKMAGIHIKKFCKNREDEYSPFREFIRRCKTTERIKHYGIPDIDLKYLKGIWESQSGICSYTGIKMILPKSVMDYDKIHSLKKASLDRIDSSKGYIKGNVEFVCSSINLAKNSFTREKMKEFLSEIIPNHI
jgi:hypothetical protein